MNYKTKHSLQNFSKLRSELAAHAESCNYNLNSYEIDTLIKYLQLLHKWNGAYNLSGIKNADEMLQKHIFETLSVSDFIKNWGTKLADLNHLKIVDVGAGAGIPSLILAIIMPNVDFLAIDSNGKKTRFMHEVIAQLNLKNARVLHKRLPLAQSDEKFDIVISRAFTNFADFFALTQNLAYEKSYWFAMKTRVSAEELSNVPKNFSILQKVELDRLNKTSLYIFDKNLSR